MHDQHIICIIMLSLLCLQIITKLWILTIFRKRPRESYARKSSSSSGPERPKSAAPFLQIQGHTINPSQQRSSNFRSKSAIGLRNSHPGAGDAATPPTSINGQLGLDKVNWHVLISYNFNCTNLEVSWGNVHVCIKRDAW